MKPQVAVFLLLLLASIAAAQNPSQPSANQAASTLSTDQAVITNQDVIGMLRTGLSPEIVAAKVKNSKCQCDTSPAALEQLRAAAVPDSVILAMVESAAPAAQKPSGLADIRDAKSVCLVNGSTDLKVFDDVRKKLQQWGRWTIVQRPEEADLLLVLSEKETYLGTMSTASATVNNSGTTAGNISSTHASGSGTSISIPLMSQKLFLIAVDRASNRPLVAVSSERHHVFRPASNWLVARMRNQIEKHEKSQAH